MKSTSKKVALDIATDDDGNYMYSMKQAPCVCVFGTNQYHGTHGLMHAHQGLSNRTNAVDQELEFLDQKATVPALKYSQARDSASQAVCDVFPKSECDPECLKAQLDAYHKDGLEIEDDDYVKAIDTGYTSDADVKDAGFIIKADYKVTAQSKATGGRISMSMT